MSTSDKEFGTKVYPGWVWTLPNMAFDVPAIDIDVIDENGDTIITKVSIREYLNMPDSETGIFKNRDIKPLRKGTHSSIVFDSKYKEIVAFRTMLEENGIVDGDEDFTIDSDTVYYSHPISMQSSLLKESPLNKVVTNEATL